MNLLEVWAFADEWAPRVTIAGLILIAVGAVRIVWHRRAARPVQVPSVKPAPEFVPGRARAADPLPDDVMDVARAADVVVDR